MTFARYQISWLALLADHFWNIIQAQHLEMNISI
jgi:hypothetical protein